MPDEVKTTMNQLWLNQELSLLKILVKDTVEANGKVYEYAGKSRSRGADKLTYDKTHLTISRRLVSQNAQ